MSAENEDYVAWPALELGDILWGTHAWPLGWVWLRYSQPYLRSDHRGLQAHKEWTFTCFLLAEKITGKIAGARVSSGLRHQRKKERKKVSCHLNYLPSSSIAENFFPLNMKLRHIVCNDEIRSSRNTNMRTSSLAKDLYVWTWMIKKEEARLLRFYFMQCYN